MKCHLCERPAVDRCYTCGRLFCESHGTTNCTACTNGIVAGDPRPDRVTADFARRAEPVNTWWRPQVAEEYEPPACYICHGLTRSTCRQCNRQFCPEHGKDQLCRDCRRSSTVGLLGLALLLAAVLGLALFGLLQ